MDKFTQEAHLTIAPATKQEKHLELHEAGRYMDSVEVLTGECGTRDRATAAAKRGIRSLRQQA